MGPARFRHVAARAASRPPRCRLARWVDPLRLRHVPIIHLPTGICIRMRAHTTLCTGCAACASLGQARTYRKHTHIFDTQIYAHAHPQMHADTHTPCNNSLFGVHDGRF